MRALGSPTMPTMPNKAESDAENCVMFDPPAAAPAVAADAGPLDQDEDMRITGVVGTQVGC